MTSTSILSLPSGKAIAKEYLKYRGFKQITWGAPKKVDVRKVRGKNTRILTFDESQYCWEWFDDGKQLDDYYKTLIYYYPAEFDAYVVPFQGNRKEPLHPAKYALISIDNTSDVWYERVLIETEDDIELLFAIAKKRISYLNKKFFGIE